MAVLHSRWHLLQNLQDVYVEYLSLHSPVFVLTSNTAPQAGGQVFNDVIATRSPDAVVNSHGQNSFALEDGIATRESYHGKKARLDIESIGERSASVIENEDYPVPTEEESKNLRKVADSIPGTAWLLCIVELAERASFYGVQTVFSNFMQFPLPEGGNGAGAVGSPEQTAGVSKVAVRRNPHFLVSQQAQTLHGCCVQRETPMRQDHRPRNIADL